MTNAKLFDKLGTLLEGAENADEKHIKKLRKVLHKLKKRQRKLSNSLEQTEGSHERRKLRQEIEVLKMQREKGVKVYKTLKKTQTKASDEAAEKQL